MGADIDPDIPGLDESALNGAELSITIPDLLSWDQVEVITQGEASETEIEEYLEQDRVVVIIPNVEDLINLSDLDFASIIEAIRTGLQFIETALEGTSFYRREIPIINRTVADSFQFLYDFLDKIEVAAEDPAAVLQEVEGIIEDALGLTDPDAFGLSLDTSDPDKTVVKIHIEWIKLLSDYIDPEYMNLSFAFDLGSIIGIFGGSLGSGWDFINELVSGGADVSWDAQVEMVVDLGIDVTDIVDGDIDFFLYDYDSGDDTGTHINLGVKVEATDLELMFNPLGIGVTGGSAHLGQLTYDGTHDYYYTEGARVTEADFAEFTLAIDQQSGGGDDGRFYFASEDFGDNWTWDLAGGFDIYLPLEIPLVTVTPLHVYTNNAPDPAGWGDEALLESFKRLGGHTPEVGEAEAVIVDLPDITVMDDFGLLSLLNDPTFILDGIDLVLGTVGDVLGSSFAQDIPLIGDKLYKAASFLRDIRTGFLADLREKLNGPGAAIKYVRDSMWDVFGPGGLDIILDGNEDGRITIDDIGVDWYGEDGSHLKEWKEGERVPMSGYIYDGDDTFVSTSGTPTGDQYALSEDADAIQFDVPLGGIAFGTGVDIPFDAEFGPLALDIDGGFAVEMNWSYDFIWGLSVTDYLYMGTNDETAPEDPELEVEIAAFLDGEPLDNGTVTPFYAEGKLLFFIVSVEDIDRDEGRPGFQPSGVFGFLEVDVLGDSTTGRVTINHLISSPIDEIFDINFGVEATLNVTMTLDIGDVGLPRLKADFIASWSWDLENGAGEPEFGLYNLRIDIGTFITDILKPITDKISGILEPFRPIVEVFTTEVGGLDAICDPPTLLGLVNLILSTLGYSEIPVEFFNAVRTMLDVVDQVDAMIGREGEILLGDIIGFGGSLEARQAESSLPSWLSDFMNNLNFESQGITASSGNSFSSGGTSTERGGFEIIDHILDIGNWMSLISGGDAILFTYEMPLFEYTLSFKQDIAVITAGPAVITVSAVGNFGFEADLGFGYDTYGIRKAIDTSNWWYVFDGFYVADFGITSGVEKDEFTVTLEIGLEATLWLLLVEAGLGGVVGFTMGLDLQDVNDDGRIHPTEFVEMWNYTGNDAPGGFLNLINLHGEVYFRCYVFVDVGISIPIVGKIMKRVVDLDLFNITLAEWDYNAPKVQPVLAHVEGSDLIIHAGRRAGMREYLNTEDGGENFTISGNSSSITVEFDEWSQVYTVDGGSFEKVIADGDAGKDTFDASELTGVDVEFSGGDDKDQLIASQNGGATLIGDGGEDTLDASRSTGTVLVRGGDGDDRITGGSGENELYGDGGDDRITGGGSGDKINGGAGGDTLYGMAALDTYYFATAFGQDNFRDIEGDTVIDLSSVTDDLTVTISSTSISILTPAEELRLGRAQVSKLILGTGKDTIYVSDPPEGTLEIVDAGGPSTTIFTFSRNTSSKPDGIIFLNDSDGDFDEVILENIAGIEMNAGMDDIIVVNDHEVRSGRLNTTPEPDVIEQGREVIRFSDEVERFTVVAQEGEVDPETTETTWYPINLTISSTAPAGAEMGESSISVSSQNLRIRPSSESGSMHFAAGGI
ncbi:MAG: calcium-binding protein, partial [Desulfuromonadales bacterium]